MKAKSAPMKDTPMDLNPDPMCIPTLGHVFWGERKSYATELREYIEFIVSAEHIDPLESDTIY